MDKVTAYLKKIGRKGGSVRSEKKAEAVRRNLGLARLKRWPVKGEVAGVSVAEPAPVPVPEGAVESIVVTVAPSAPVAEVGNGI
jgi:hypothetical protein